MIHVDEEIKNLKSRIEFLEKLKAKVPDLHLGHNFQGLPLFYAKSINDYVDDISFNTFKVDSGNDHYVFFSRKIENITVFADPFSIIISHSKNYCKEMTVYDYQKSIIDNKLPERFIPKLDDYIKRKIVEGFKIKNINKSYNERFKKYIILL